MTTATQTEQEKGDYCITEAVKGNLRPFMDNFLIIRGEDDEYIPFHHNTIQAHYETAKTLRNVIVKPRKIGFTTRWLAEHFTKMLVTPGYETLALTFDEDEAEYMFGIVRRFYDHLPKNRQPKLGKDTGRAMSFSRVDSSMTIQSAGGRRKGRGRTPSAILLDEFAHYDEAVAVDVYSSVVNSAPLHTEITIQSTPLGIGNEFHRQFLRAEQGSSTFKSHFYPWMWLPEKHRLATDDRLVLDKPWLRGELEFSDEEINLVQSWNEQHPDMLMGQDHIRWRRYKIAEDPYTFKQEYPENKVACFLATTETVLDSERLNFWMQRAKPPLHREMNGHLKVWRRPQPGTAYCIGVDCGEGIPGRDNSAAIVGTVNGEVVAVLCGIIDQAEMAQLVHDIGNDYFGAFVLNERQGGFTFQRDLYNMGYKHLYRHDEAKEVGRRAVSTSRNPLGFPTTTASKMQLITRMRNALRSDSFQCPDAETLQELMEFKRHNDGTYGAPVGAHDDRAMAAMLYLKAVEESGRTSVAVRQAVAGTSAARGMIPFRGELFV